MASTFDRDFAQRFASAQKSIAGSEARLQALADKVGQTRTIQPKAYWDKVIRSAEREYKSINSVLSSFVKREVPRRYRNSIIEMSTRIDGLKSVLNKAKKSTKALIESSSSRQTVLALYQQATEDILAATFNGMNDFKRLIRGTQQALVEEQFLNIAVAEGFEEGNIQKAITTIRRGLKAEVGEALSSGKFVKAGSRHYKASTYAEMVARTKFHEAHSHAAIATAVNYGTDLIIISTHNTTTEICLPYEGKVFSITGADKRFPVLDLYPPFHPDCLHLMYPQFESGMIAQGSLEKFIDFSNGKADRPPFPDSFVPISKRKAV